MKHVLLCSTTLGMAVASSTCAWAQTATADPSGTQLQEVVVTAERRSVDLQKTALAVSAIDGKTIQKRGDSDFAQVLQNVPGVVIQSADNAAFGGPPVIAIRGLGTDTGSAAVSTYENGVFVNQSGAMFYDLDRVEVLRGPQGTLYGRNATGGAVNIVETQPKQAFEALGQVEYGSYSLMHTTGALNAPLTDTLAVRVAFNQIKHDGYDSHNYGDQDEWNTRVQALWRPTDKFSFLAGAVVYQSEGQGPMEIPLDANGNAKGYYDPDPRGGYKHIAYQRYYSNVVWDLGPAILTYIPAYQNEYSAYDYYGGPGELAGKIPQSNDHSEELRLSNPAGSRLIWQAGVYYDKTNWVSNLQGSVIATGTPPDATYFQAIGVDQYQHQQNEAVFGEMTYPILDHVRLTGGLRETWFKVDYLENDNIFFVPTSYNLNLNYNHFDWRARVDADLTPTSLVYAMASTGFRPGGAAVNGAAYGPETVNAYEIGSKNRFLDNRLQLNLAAYYYDYAGFQTAVPITDPAHPSLIIGEGVAVVPAKFYGLELEAQYQVTPNDLLTFSPAYEKANYTENYISSGVTTLTKGKTPTHVPEWQLAGSYAHTFRLKNDASLVVSLDGKYQASQYNGFTQTLFNNLPGAADYVTHAYALGNASLTYTFPSQKFSVGVYARNFTNVEYKLEAINGPTGVVGYVNDPRTFGVTLSARY